MRNKWKLCLLGIISGFLSFSILWVSDKTILEGFMWYGPGLVFGIITSFYFVFFTKHNYKWLLYRIVLWMALSTISYYVAVQVTIRTMDSSLFNSLNLLPHLDFSPPPLSFFVGGSVGASLLLIGFWLLWFSVTFFQFPVIVFLGGLLGVSFYLGPSGWEMLQHLILFVFWQTGIAFSLGYIIDRKEVSNKLSSYL